jgi:glycine cleavage system aminomethyltransferase T
MTYKNLEAKLEAAGNVAEMLRNAQTGPNVYPGVPAEFSNWRDEQQAWQETCVLFDQSYHMADLLVEGPGAFGLLEHLAINSFKGFKPGKAKQFVPCTPDGYVIGDVILFYLAENTFNLVGRAPSLNWVQFHAATGDWDVTCTLDERTAARKDPSTRKSYRYQVQGPNAMKTIEKALGEPPPDLKFFEITEVAIAGRKVSALRHGMAGQPGFEFFGPWRDGEAVKEALVEAGQEFGLRKVGGRTYASNTLESGWIPSPLPAIYTGDSLKAYREWLPANGYEGSCSIGGSFVSDNIEDYYLTPWDLGYGSFIKFNHDFIGREALEKMANDKHRHKVTLALNSDDVGKVIASYLQREEERGKFIDFPSAVYAMHPFDKVTVDGRIVGVSTWVGYSANERTMLTLAMVEAAYAEPGTEVVFVWGEEDGGSAKPTVESHVQMEIRAIVSPVPYVEVARTAYSGKKGWRETQST